MALLKVPSLQVVQGEGEVGELERAWLRDGWQDRQEEGRLVLQVWQLGWQAKQVWLLR